MLRKIVSFLLTLLLVAGCFSACTTDEILDPSTNTTATTVPTESIPEGAGFVIGSEILNYFYLDAVQQQYASWSNTFGDNTDSYLSMYFGLDTSRALDQQIYDQENALTWADLLLSPEKRMLSPLMPFMNWQNLRITNSPMKQKKNSTVGSVCTRCMHSFTIPLWMK